MSSDTSIHSRSGNTAPLCCFASDCSTNSNGCNALAKKIGNAVSSTFSNYVDAWKNRLDTVTSVWKQDE